MQKKKTSTPTPVIKPAITSANGKQINYKGIYFFIAFLTFLLYANTLGHNYTVDDSTVIENNKFTVKGFGGLKEILPLPIVPVSGRGRKGYTSPSL
ncbi:MAG: hypothetical protein IPP46_01515 [Bacteroidetes bacterium]|nr:hypothetical protein [Bacteroidota bacterium]